MTLSMQVHLILIASIFNFIYNLIINVRCSCEKELFSQSNIPFL